MQWSSPDMVDETYDIYRIAMGTTHCATLGKDCRILKQKNPSEGSDEAPRKSENSNPVSNHNASCCPVRDVFFVKRLESQMYDKNS